MRKFIRGIFDKLGYEIIKRESGLPSRQTLNSNLLSLLTAYELIFQQIEGTRFKKNELRKALLSRGQGTRAPEGFYIVKALEETAEIEGDVCEFGVAQGETSALIANEIKETNKTLHLFDSFQGLSRPTPEDTLKDDILSLGQMSAYHGTMKCSKDRVISRLHNINFPDEQVFIHTGFIEDTLQASLDLPTKISFAYIDFDLYSPINSALEYIASRTDHGAVLIIDDYDFFSTGVKKAVDDFIQTHPSFQMQIPSIEFGHFAILRRNL